MIGGDRAPVDRQWRGGAPPPDDLHGLVRRSVDAEPVAPADDAMIESFSGRMQVELLNRKRWKTRIELAAAIHDSIELWHNTPRQHSALGMLAPTEYEKLHQDTNQAA